MNILSHLFPAYLNYVLLDSLSFCTCLSLGCICPRFKTSRGTFLFTGQACRNSCGELVSYRLNALMFTSHLGTAENGRTLVFLTTEQFNQSSWGLSTLFNGTSPAAFQGVKNTIYLFSLSLYTQWGFGPVTFMLQPLSAKLQANSHSLSYLPLSLLCFFSHTHTQTHPINEYFKGCIAAVIGSCVLAAVP